MSSNLQNSIWPNAGGTLGEIKVQIPTGDANDPWPTGDALVNNFVYQNGKLVGFVDTKALIANDSKSTIFPYDYVNIQVDKSLQGVMTFNKGERTKYLTVTYTESGNTGDTIVLGTKYLGCTTIEEVKAVDPDYLTNDIVDGVWSQSLADLTYGNQMFEGCSQLTSFSSDLSSMTDGNTMFNCCSNLVSFNADLSSMTSCTRMFSFCGNLSSFSSDLSSLTKGTRMFFNCFSLESFTSGLPNLTGGAFMFQGCMLDTASVQNIADTINTLDTISDTGNITIGIGNTTPNEQEVAAFNKMVSKNWIVYVGINGDAGEEWNPTSLTPENGEETTTPIPFWAKPVPSDEENAQYVDSEGNFYNILGGNFIYGDNLENYGMFTSLEDAAAQMRLTKIEK